MSVQLRVVARAPSPVQQLPGPPVYALHGVDVTFGRLTGLRDVTLAIAPGESVALVGANGSGKSTLLRVLHSLQPPTLGRLESVPRSRQAMLFQRPFMLRTSARNNVALALWLRGTPWRIARTQALAALDRVGLADRADQLARTLSGGQQQRLALARAWALRPEVLLLDEPTASLDPHAKREVEQLIAEFGAGRALSGAPMTVVFASHNLGQVKRLATRVIYLEEGLVQADLPVQQFFDPARLQAVSPAAALFVKGELA
ncbi:MAG: phosphate ABC transporter ATP-binding protein [Curvibacter sp.]|jgi:tungstate transport system ATP-binding protein|nr:phosphate ABC transporter ATP-binding protein [Curvibacter sp.]